MRVSLVFALCLSLLATSCVQFTYLGAYYDQPVEDAAFAGLVPGESSLQDCLDALGAPHVVQEYRVHGMSMAWGWTDEVGWGADVSYGFDESPLAASFSWDSVDRFVAGLVLFFDAELKLETVRRGSLADILPQRRPPASIEDIEKN